MAYIKTLKIVNGFPTQIDVINDSLAAASYFVGGPSGTELTKTKLDTLTSGSGTDATSLHSHDSRYYRINQYINSSVGSASAALPIITDVRGKLDPSLLQQSDITHGNLTGLSADDHPQYFNITRGDARYYTQAQFVSVSAGISSAGLPVKLNASGQIDSTMINSSSSNHESLSGLLGGAAGDHFHLTGANTSTLISGSADASSLHNHNTQYYTKIQTDAFLALKANDNIVIKKDGSVAFTASQSLGGNKITNLQDGSASSDASTFGQTTNALALKLNKSGDTMTGNLNMSANSITNLADPVNPTDAANKQYVDNSRAGLNTKAPVLVATTTNLAALSGLLTIDGVTVTAGSRVLVKDQTTQSQNGIYVAAAGLWTRATDQLTSIKEGDYVFVDLGTTWARSSWVISTPDPITVGSTSVLWIRYNAAGQLIAGTGISIIADTLSVNLGAGVTELSTGSVGIDIKSDGGLYLVDPSTGLASLLDSSQLSVKLADTTLVRSASGVAVGVVQTANIAPTAITTAKIANQAVTQTQLANLSVGTAQLIDANVTTVKILDANVTGAKLAANTAGAGLSQNVSSKALDVQFDNTSIDLNGSNQVEIKALGVTNAKIAALAVNAPKIDFGTGANQVSATNIPLNDTANRYLVKTTEGALSEIGNAAYIEVVTAGETIGQGDLVVVRRDSLNNSRVYKASAASADNQIKATSIIQDITYTSANAGGNNISVTYVNPGAVSSALAVTVTANDITVSLATNGSAAITSTATSIAGAVNASPAAFALVSASVSGIGTNIQTVQPKTFLTGGTDYSDNGYWEVFGVALDAATLASTFRVKKIGRFACSFVTAPAAGDVGKGAYLSINKGKAVVFTAPSSSGDGAVYLGRIVSTTEIEFRAPSLRYVN